MKYIKNIPKSIYVILTIAILVLTYEAYMTHKANDIIDRLDAQTTKDIEIHASDYKYDDRYTIEVSDKKTVEKIIASIKSFKGRTDYSKYSYLDPEYDNYRIVIHDQDRGIFIDILGISYMQLMYYDYDKQAYSDRFHLKGKWLLDDLNDLFSLNDQLTDYVSEAYSGRELDIGVVGSIPSVREPMINFTKLDLEDLLADKLAYDAVFISSESLNDASSSEYVEAYKKLEIPIFFLDAYTSISPFVMSGFYREDIYSENYVVGLCHKGHTFEDYAFKLKYNIENEKNIQDAFSRIFKTIEAGL